MGDAPLGGELAAEDVWPDAPAPQGRGSTIVLALNRTPAGIIQRAMNKSESDRVSTPSPAGCAGKPRSCAPRRRGRPAKGARPDGDRLLRAAALAFAEQGFEGASLRAIAAAADVDPALIAYRFGGKEALWRAVIEDFAEEVRAVLGCGAGGPCGDRLTGFLDALAGLSCRRPELARMLLREACGPDQGERADHIREALTRPIRDRLAPLVAEAEAARPPEARADPDVRLFAILGAICMVLATRPSLAAFTGLAGDETALRAELLRSLRLPPCPDGLPDGVPGGRPDACPEACPDDDLTGA